MTLPIHVRIGEQTVLPDPFPRLWRQGHDRELNLPGPSAKSPDRNYRGDAGGYARDTKGKMAIPEPFRILPDHQTPLDCSCQKLIRELNPDCPDDVVDIVLDQAWILANNTGLGQPGRKNCRTGEYMNTTGAQWPAFHAPIICGGALLSGKALGGYLYIESIPAGGPIPAAAEVLRKPWLWFWLIEVNAQGVPTYMTYTGKPVRVPLITKKPVYVPLDWLDELPAGTVPTDPRKYG
jgi:hypothetical protein